MTKTVAGQSTRHAEVAIVGAGPSGCYTAIALRRLMPDAAITVFDRRMTPFGLLRYGVAADHQGMKNVARQFDRVFASPGVRFVGNTGIGRDLSLTDLHAAFDAVVVATGLPNDRPIGIAVHPDARVLGAGELLRFINADPDSVLRGADADSCRPLGESVVVVGAGNVAMDVARLLSKTAEDLVGSDVDDEARAALEAENLRRIDIVARGPRDRVRWDAAMLRELCELPGVGVSIDGEQVAGDGEPRVAVNVHFAVDTRAVDHRDGRAVLAGTHSASNTEVEFVADTVITAIGFVAESDAPVDPVISTQIFRVGGAQSGVLGNLAQNRAAAKNAAAQVADALSVRCISKPGLAGVEHLLPARVVDFADWRIIDDAEVARARPGRCRTKFNSREEMIDVVRSSDGVLV
ncbi:FAD-dependent oxidoreductase [Gordonia amicalis]|uniref:FAD-dependent oxidoreductase n=1 Tax=Gordonia amicalis TaxID=89053 RepID=UPI0022A7D87C|nr:FAD-dependent oxidoreductase [Gordonia amicalis]MCZ0911502.1 FAD-dependent oxidoreductase [Gordonia amicalis]